MKKYPLFIIVLAIIFAWTVGYAQQTKKPQANKAVSDQVDTRIDNMGYWMEKAKQGLVPYSQPIPIKPAEYTGSKINVKGIKSIESIDVPVTNLTNVTESENSVFVDPNNANYILNSNNSTSWSGGSVGTLYGANYFQSSNGGTTWGGTPNGAGGSNSGDPTTAIGLNGREYVNYITNPGGQGIAWSDDGTTWSAVTIAPNPGSLADKNHMWIDNKAGSPYEGNLYTAWTDFGGGNNNNIVISRSTNDGLSWSSLINLSSAVAAGSHNQGVNIQTGPGGEVYVCWAIYDGWPTDETAIGFAKSTNGGVSYTAGTRIKTGLKGIRTSGSTKNHRVNSFPSMAVDISGGPNNGNLYIVWTNIGTPGVNTGSNRSVYMIRSTNGGTTWSAAIKVNQNPFIDGDVAYFPWISCDPVTGVLSTVFYDDRNVTAGGAVEVFSAYSLNAGATWTDFVISDVSFTPSPIPGLASSYMGDYLGITSKGGKVYPCWTDTRGGLFMTYVSPYELGLNADFMANNTTPCTGSTVTFSDLSTGSPISWTWSFTGGTPSSYVGQTPPAITYSTPGSYNVSLTVGDGTATDTETKTGYISVQNVIANFSGTPTTVVVGNTVTFTDNSSCSPTSWSWSFPGGTPATATGVGPHIITYNTLGTYDASLTVTKSASNDTETKTSYITVIAPEFNMTNGTVTTCTGNFYDSGGPSGNYQNNENFTETFYPSTSGAMIRFTFASFNTESGYDYLRIYNGTSVAAPLIGTYNGTTGPGTVTASNAAGALTFNFTSDYSVTPAGWSAAITCYSTSLPPVANFSASNTSPFVGETVIFTDLSNNAPTTWAWSFNPTSISYVGGTNANSQNPQVQFNSSGLYTVTLAVTNAYGSDSEVKTNYINVIHTIPPYVENFETFAAGNYVALTSPYWTTWSNLPGGTEDAVIVSTPTHGGTKSVKIDGVNDLVLPLGDKTSGKYIISFYMYVPSGNYGYYNLLQLFNGASSEWGAEIFFSTSGAGYGNAGGSNSFTFSYSYNTWFFMKNVIDLDNDLAQIYLNGTLLKQWQWSLGALGTSNLNQLGGLDMYAWNVNGTPLYYFDDLSYYEILQLDVTAYLEGPFTGASMTPYINGLLPLSQPYNIAPWNYTGTESVAAIPNVNIIDWLLIELRDAPTAGQATGATMIARQAAFLLNNGKVVGLDGSSVLRFESPFFNNLYPVIHHRNHLGIMPANGLTQTGGIYTYNYSTGVGQVYGGINGHKELSPGVWGMISGDGDRNKTIGTGDKSPLWEDQAGTRAYQYSDYNLDGQSDNSDKDDKWVPNIGKGCQVPN
jgi:PKD repeat protein